MERQIPSNPVAQKIAKEHEEQLLNQLRIPLTHISAEQFALYETDILGLVHLLKPYIDPNQWIFTTVENLSKREMLIAKISKAMKTLSKDHHNFTAATIARNVNMKETRVKHLWDAAMLYKPKDEYGLFYATRPDAVALVMVETVRLPLGREMVEAYAALAEARREPVETEWLGSWSWWLRKYNGAFDSMVSRLAKFGKKSTEESAPSKIPVPEATYAKKPEIGISFLNDTVGHPYIDWSVLRDETANEPNRVKRSPVAAQHLLPEVASVPEKPSDVKSKIQRKLHAAMSKRDMRSPGPPTLLPAPVVPLLAEKAASLAKQSTLDMRPTHAIAETPVAAPVAAEEPNRIASFAAGFRMALEDMARPDEEGDIPEASALSAVPEEAQTPEPEPETVTTPSNVKMPGIIYDAEIVDDVPLPIKGLLPPPAGNQPTRRRSAPQPFGVRVPVTHLDRRLVPVGGGLSLFGETAPAPQARPVPRPARQRTRMPLPDWILYSVVSPIVAMFLMLAYGHYFGHIYAVDYLWTHLAWVIGAFILYAGTAIGLRLSPSLRMPILPPIRMPDLRTPTYRRATLSILGAVLTLASALIIASGGQMAIKKHVSKSGVPPAGIHLNAPPPARPAEVAPPAPPAVTQAPLPAAISTFTGHNLGEFRDWYWKNLKAISDEVWAKNPRHQGRPRPEKYYASPRVVARLMPKIDKDLLAEISHWGYYISYAARHQTDLRSQLARAAKSLTAKERGYENTNPAKFRLALQRRMDPSVLIWLNDEKTVYEISALRKAAARLKGPKRDALHAARLAGVRRDRAQLLWGYVDGQEQWVVHNFADYPGAFSDLMQEAVAAPYAQEIFQEILHPSPGLTVDVAPRQSVHPPVTKNAPPSPKRRAANRVLSRALAWDCRPVSPIPCGQPDASGLERPFLAAVKPASFLSYPPDGNCIGCWVWCPGDRDARKRAARYSLYEGRA